MSWPLITAHTGCMQTSPNSVDSAIEGLKAGADIIEVDVRATKDGVVVLRHDEEVSTSYGNGRIQDLTHEELKEWLKGEQLTRLDEILPLVHENRRMINLDVKEDSAIGPMIRTVEDHNMRDYVIISGCEKERAAYLKENYRSYQVLLNASVSLFAAANGDYDFFMKQTCRDAIASSCCGININYRLVKDELLVYAKLRCMPVLVWTVDKQYEMEGFLDARVHSITTNEVKVLMELRDKRKHQIVKGWDQDARYIHV